MGYTLGIICNLAIFFYIKLYLYLDTPVSSERGVIYRCSKDSKKCIW